MFNLPPHITDPSLYCEEIKRNIPYPTIKDIECRKLELEKEFVLNSQEHDTLCFNLGLNADQLPDGLFVLEKMYQDQKHAVQTRIKRQKKKRLARIEKLQSQASKLSGIPSDTSSSDDGISHKRNDAAYASRLAKVEAQLEREMDKFFREERSGKIAASQLLLEWQPVHEASARRDVGLSEEWKEGLLEYKKQVLDEIKTWQSLATTRPNETIDIKVTYRDGSTQQSRSFRVSNTMSVNQFLKLTKKAFSISLEMEQLGLFSQYGPVKEHTNLNQYDTNRIAELRLFKIFPVQRKGINNQKHIQES